MKRKPRGKCKRQPCGCRATMTKDSGTTYVWTRAGIRYVKPCPTY